ncbi:MAG: stage III sporulation protein AB [Limnochordia bacterium]|jgi:stage III sporulation protein AB|nr:stage III sporulation protein AB [Bacillota bacterium]HOB08071.1 stage III sporulation protein AB [Limnochordia bacterium]NLH32266.1 stage III sporulation protein AB [Bacillota bacterium]HPT92456.1 stage III sporulation protein AB [Limnochordia bacterium]HPZ30234.1 stage III sporulation protein AB [Limnochordia bacterium]
MLRILGAGLVVAACGAGGLIMARSYSVRPQNLQSLAAAVQMLATEIHYARSSLPEACRRIAGQIDNPAAAFFARFAEVLAGGRGLTAAEALDQSLAVLADAGFANQDIELISQLGAVLGRSDAEDQLKHLAILYERLEHSRIKAEQERDKMARLWNYLGFCVGALVVLMLI